MILKPTEEKIYELLKQRATSQDQHGHFCVYPRKQLAFDCGVNEKTVRRILNELEEKNTYIEYGKMIDKPKRFMY